MATSKPREKKPKKEATGKVRHVAITAKPKSGTIEVKLYALDAELAAPFMRNDVFTFRIAFDATDANGKFRRFHVGRCPFIGIKVGEVIQTENETAQRMIENFIVPTNTSRNGEKRKGGHFFKDVTQSANDYDLDLDEQFARAAAAVTKD